MTPPIALTLLNPHADDFVSTPVSFKLVGRQGLGKYKYLIDEPIRRGLRISILVDGTLSSLVEQTYFNRLPAWLRHLILRVEIFIWLRQNDLTNRADIHWSIDTIKDRSALYLFSYKNCVGSFDQRRSTISSFRHALINLSHYFIRTREKAENIDKLPNACLVTDSDLDQNDYFRKFFTASLPKIVLPFAVNERFVAKRPLAQRDAKCAATGSFHNLRNETPQFYYCDFMELFQTNTYHPLRKMLFEKKDELSNWIDCRISPYREISDNKGPVAKLRRLLGLDMVQAEYFSFNIVDFYNQHRFAIVGEELSGAPAVGFFEAMSCGNVTLGQRGSFYDGLGLEPELHYLPHDGTIAGVLAQLEKANADFERVRRISEAGLTYVAAHCTPASVWDAFERRLKGIMALPATNRK